MATGSASVLASPECTRWQLARSQSLGGHGEEEVLEGLESAAYVDLGDTEKDEEAKCGGAGARVRRLAEHHWAGLAAVPVLCTQVPLGLQAVPRPRSYACRCPRCSECWGLTHCLPRTQHSKIALGAQSRRSPRKMSIRPPLARAGSGALAGVALAAESTEFSQRLATLSHEVPPA